VLAGAGAAAGAVVLTACNGKTGGGSAGGGSAGGSGQELTELAKVPVGGAVSAQTPDGKPVIVAQPTKGRVVAFSAICTHLGCTVAPAGRILQCPCHGSQYNATTGDVIRGPAPRALSQLPVKVDNGQVVTDG
jgi:Rieske Fe-S protein